MAIHATENRSKFRAQPLCIASTQIGATDNRVRLSAKFMPLTPEAHRSDRTLDHDDPVLHFNHQIVISELADPGHLSLPFFRFRCQYRKRSALKVPILCAPLLNGLFSEPTLSAPPHDDDVASFVYPELIHICATSMKHLP
jgi:hypothetical protein